MFKKASKISKILKKIYAKFQDDWLTFTHVIVWENVLLFKHIFFSPK